MGARLGTVIGFGIVSAVVFAIFFAGADNRADEILSTAEENESLAESAPQQVVAAWATRDAAVEQVRQNGIRNGLLGVCAAMLTSIAVILAIQERRREGQFADSSPPSAPVGDATSNPPGS